MKKGFRLKKALSLYMIITFLFVFGTNFPLPGFTADMGDYISDFDTTLYNDKPKGVGTDGTNIWISDYDNDTIYKYDMSGTYISEFNTHIGNSLPKGVGTDGTNIYVAEFWNNQVFKYDMSGVYVSKFDTHADNGGPYGLGTDGSYIWVTDLTDSKVFKYDMSGTYISNFSTTAHPAGLGTDGVNIWVCDYVTGQVSKYSMSGVYISNFSTIPSGNYQPYGLAIWETSIYTSNYTLGITGKIYVHSSSSNSENVIADSCTSPSDDEMNILFPYLETYIDRTLPSSAFNMVIDTVELFVSIEQYNLVSDDKNDYDLYVNNVSVGTADGFLIDSPNRYVLRWVGIDQNITTDDIVLEWRCLSESGAVNWFALPYVASDDSTSYYHNTPDAWGNGVPFGVPFYDTKSTVHCIYYELTGSGASHTQDNSILTLTYYGDDPLEYNNYVYFEVDSTENTNIYYALTNDTGKRVWSGSRSNTGYWFVQDAWYDEGYYGSPGDNCTIHVWVGDVWDEFYPDWGELYANSLNDTFVISGGSTKTYSTTPYPDPMGGSLHGFTAKAPVDESVYCTVYNVFHDVVIYNTSGFDGSGSTLISFDDVYMLSYSGAEGLHYIYMYNATTNEKITSATSHFVAISTSGFSYEFYIDDLNIVDGDLITVYGSHTYTRPGQHFEIEINRMGFSDTDESFYHDFEVLSSDASSFSESVQVHGTGYYIVRAKIDNVYIDDYSIVVTVTGTSTDDDGGGILPSLGKTWGMIMGLMIVSFFTLLPLLLTHMTNQKGFSFTIPAIVYVLFAGIGALISFAFELFQDWVLFFIIAIGIIALGILYLIGQRQNVGG